MAKFSGFPREYFSFFNQLKKNNSKEWFEKHRSEYDEFVLHPAREFVIEMGKKLRKIAPGVNAIPKINQIGRCRSEIKILSTLSASVVKNRIYNGISKTNM